MGSVVALAGQIGGAVALVGQVSAAFEKPQEVVSELIGVERGQIASDNKL